MKTTFKNMTDQQRQTRMNLRNAWLAESVEDLRAQAGELSADGKWFEAACLLELALEE